MITKSLFGKLKDGREVFAYTITDGDKKAVVLDYGGTVQSLVVPDRDGNPVDVLLGYDTIDGYENNGGYLSALIGRFGNRIDRGRLTIDGKTYQLACNDRGNHLHGGLEGFDKKIWQAEIVADRENCLRLHYVSPDGEEGYPGSLSAEVYYTFCDGTFGIEYIACTDKRTVVNLTNHAYFNLNGDKRGDVLNTVVQINADTIVPTNDTLVPVGGFRSVKGTAFDFNEPKTIGKDIGADDADLKLGGGYDHCFLLRKERDEIAQYASAYSPETGIRLTCSTDAPAVQFYTGNGLDQTGKKGKYYGARAGFCLETQMIPNNVNVPAYEAYGTSYLDVGEVYRVVSQYRFTTEK